MPREDVSESSLHRDTDWNDVTRRVIGLFDQPAYMRRALHVEDSISAFQRQLATHRDKAMETVRRHLRVWVVVASRKPQAVISLPRQTIDTLSDLQSILITNRSRLPPPLWLPKPSRVLKEIKRSIEQFNERRDAYIEIVDLSTINARIDEYNRLYLLEKECAFRSPRAAARGFVPMAEIGRDWVRENYPLLPTIEI